MKRAIEFLKENIWVWAGTGLVLITLSGQTRQYGIMLSSIAVVMQLTIYLVNKEEDKE